jgi:hypothetical protein
MNATGAGRTKTQQRIDQIVSDPKTVSDVMIAIDRLNYILSRINNTTLEAEIRVECAIKALGLARGYLTQANL